MSTPELRVRLTAEGVAEVVSALRRIQDETGKVASKSGKNFGGLNSVLGATNGLLGQLGVALSVGAAVSFLKASSDLAEELGRVREETGATATEISALKYLATQTDIEFGAVEGSLARLSVKMADLAKGEASASAAFRRVGLSAKDLKGKDTAQALELVAKGMQTLGVGATRTAAAVELFGRSGYRLVPLLNQLSDEGLSKIIARARDLGVVLDDEVIDSIKRTNDDMDGLKLQTQGLGVQFLAGLAPSITQAVQIVSGKLAGQAESWRTFGEGVGAVIKFIVALVATAFDQVGTSIGTLAIRISGFIEATKRIMKWDAIGAGIALKGANDFADEEQRKLSERTKERWRLVGKDATSQAVRGAGIPGAAGAPDVGRRLATVTGLLEKEQALYRAAAAARAKADKDAFEEGLINVTDYYAGRRDAINQAADAEVSMLQKKQAALREQDDSEKVRSDIAQADLAIQQKRIEQQGELTALAAEELKAVRSLADKRLEIEGKILAAQGDRHEQAMRDIDAEVEKADLVLRQSGATDAERQSQLASLRAALTDVETFNQAVRGTQAQLDDLANKRRLIEQDVAAGRITTLDGEKQILVLEQGRLEVLQQLAVAALAAAEATGDPEKIAQARELAFAVGDIGAKVQGANFSLTTLGNAAEQAGLQSLTEFLSSGERGAKNFGDAMRNLAVSFVQALRQMVAQALAAKILTALGIGASSASSESGGATGGQVRSLSGGGRVFGPGTWTSDSIPFRVMGGGRVWLSRDEYVVRAARTMEPGALAFLEAFNRHGMKMLAGLSVPSVRPIPTHRGLALGGAVGSALESAAGRSAATGRLDIGLSPGLLTTFFESPEGQRVLIKANAQTRRSLEALVRRTS